MHVPVKKRGERECQPPLRQSSEVRISRSPEKPTRPGATAKPRLGLVGAWVSADEQPAGEARPEGHERGDLRPVADDVDVAAGAGAIARRIGDEVGGTDNLRPAIAGPWPVRSLPATRTPPS